ncbi:hypothetical protein TIFTF001_026519 [Ficus carica]|uniref:Uncharacterized protein n=1 Tax=Ficus carica TaxID=3494 RepID=A0AA88ITJ4_FICCA|nr:hypothetical protein TIFTF001_026519 [Ficus carica]
MFRSNHNSRFMFLLFFLIDFVAPPSDPNNDTINEASASMVVDINLLTRARDNGTAEEASASGSTVSTAVLDRQVITSPSGTPPNLTEGVISNRSSPSSTSHINVAARPASTRGEPSSSSTSTSTSSKNPTCPATDEKKKGVLLCASAASECSHTHRSSASSSDNNGGSTSRTQHHPMVTNYDDSQSNHHNPSGNLDSFIRFLREQELSKNLTQVAMAIAASLYGTSDAIHPKMRLALVLLLSVGLQCFWCGTLRQNARTELLGQVLIIAAFHVLLANLMLPSSWALIPIVTYIAFLITLGVHFHKELR